MAVFDSFLAKIPFGKRRVGHGSQKRQKEASGKLTTSFSSNVKKPGSIAARRFVTTGVIISTIMVALSVFAVVYFNPETVAERTLEKMGREYYEDYYYDKFMGTISDEAFQEKMEIFKETGLQPVPLRQLLLYQNEKNAGYRSVFEKKGFACDKNQTMVKIIPKEPFGKTDYELEVALKCTRE